MTSTRAFAAALMAAAGFTPFQLNTHRSDAMNAIETTAIANGHVDREVAAFLEVLNAGGGPPIERRSAYRAAVRLSSSSHRTTRAPC
jgi:hypothetical protein